MILNQKQYDDLILVRQVMDNIDCLTYFQWKYESAMVKGTPETELKFMIKLIEIHKQVLDAHAVILATIK